MKVGIMGGTFDPIHNGHLILAEEVREKMKLEEIVFIPTGRPPHKRERKITAAEHRMAMTILATNSNPKFKVSSIEIKRRGFSYAIETIEEMKRRKEAEYYFILGSDAAKELSSWYQAEELVKECEFVVAKREGSEIEISQQKQIHVIETPKIEISSTEIRRRIKEGKSVKYLIPEAVEAYIRKENLYEDR